MDYTPQIQTIQLNMLHAVQDICDRHGLACFAIGGTLLGAVRHQGFIPWDDDIDIAMPHPDYDRFMQIAPNELPEYYEVHDFHNGLFPEHLYYNCKIYDMRTEVVLESTQTAQHVPIAIDLCPLDAMPGGMLKRQVHTFRILYHRLVTQFSMYESSAHQHRTSRPFHEKALMRFREITKLGSNWDTKELMYAADKSLRKYNYGEEDNVVIAFGVFKTKDIFPYEWFGKGVMMPFEDTRILCPVHYDKVLAQIYGDYMTPIPEDQRALQHCMTVVTLDKSEPI